MELLKERYIDIEGGKLPIRLYHETEKEDGESYSIYSIKVDGIEWLAIENMTHAVVLFEMMAEHLTEYMTFVAR